MVTVEKLKVGEIYTYPNLCEMFDEGRKAGNSKTTQLNKWRQYFKWSKPTTQKYRIEEIYPEVRLVEDRRKYNGGHSTGKFLMLDDLIMNSFEEDESIRSTIPQLSVNMGILSERYARYKYDYSDFCENNNYAIEFVSEYFASIRSCVHRAIRRSIERLQEGGFIEADNYYVLVLMEGGLQIASSEEIKIFETEVEKAMGIKRYSIKAPAVHQEFKRMVNSLIREKLGVSVRYYYKEYRLRKTTVEYIPRVNGDMWKLTRKFLLTICFSMLKYIYNAGTPSSENYDNKIKKMVNDVIDLSNYFFVYMNENAWEGYWEDDELGDSNKDLVFMVAILFEVNRRRLTRQKAKKQEVPEKPLIVYNREYAIQYLGQDEVEKIEWILPDIDWERACLDKEYAKRYAEAVDVYYDLENKTRYTRDRHMKKYCLYVARLTAHGKEKEQIHYYDFERRMDENGGVEFDIK